MGLKTFRLRKAGLHRARGLWVWARYARPRIVTLKCWRQWREEQRCASLPPYGSLLL